jgi:hypothetical protein
VKKFFFIGIFLITLFLLFNQLKTDTLALSCDSKYPNSCGDLCWGNCSSGYTFSCVNGSGVCNYSSTCNSPSLYVHNTFDNFTYTPNSGVVTNDNPPQNQDSQFYVTANASGCSVGPTYNFILRYYDEIYDYWQTLENKYWLSANNTFLSMSSGVGQYLVGVWAQGGISPENYYYFYAMNKTASSSNTTSSSVKLSWSLRMNHYIGISCGISG